MKIVVPAIGSRGDVQPYIALVQGLRAAGHDATLATNPTLVALGESHNIPVAPVGRPVDMGAAGARLYQVSRRSWWMGLIRTVQFGFGLVREAYRDVMALAQDADLVIVTDTFSGASEADALGKPWISVTLQPGRIPVQNATVSPVARALFALVNKPMMAPYNRFRKGLGAPPLKDMGSMLSQRLVLLPVSPHVARPNPLWPPQVRLTGYWNAQAPRDWTPPAGLEDFLAGPGPVIAVSLGAMSLSGADTRLAASITLEAICQAGVRAVVQGWDEALRELKLPEEVYHAGSMPHAWLFPRVQAVVHHGGFGTTASGLTAGVPAVVVPHIIDQMYWAQQVVDLGAGPAYVPRQRLTVTRLAEAIRTAVQDPAMRQRAAALGEQIRAEPDGVETAVRAVVEALNRPAL